MTCYTQLLHDHSVPVTAQRLAVFKAVAARPHNTADTLTDDAGFEIDGGEVIYWALLPRVPKGHRLARASQPI